MRLRIFIPVEIQFTQGKLYKADKQSLSSFSLCISRKQTFSVILKFIISGSHLAHVDKFLILFINVSLFIYLCFMPCLVTGIDFIVIVGRYCYVQLVMALYSKWLTNCKLVPAYSLEVEQGFELRSQKWEVSV